jgi:hypothetical protein
MIATRRPTYRRWEAALARAAAHPGAVLSDDGHRAVVAASNGRDAYLIVDNRCNCAAGQSGDTCCWHLAALHLSREQQGPEPPAPAKPARVRRVTWTPERGYVEVEQFAGRPAA